MNGTNSLYAGAKMDILFNVCVQVGPMQCNCVERIYFNLFVLALNLKSE